MRGLLGLEWGPGCPRGGSGGSRGGPKGRKTGEGPKATISKRGWSRGRPRGRPGFWHRPGGYLKERCHPYVCPAAVRDPFKPTPDCPTYETARGLTPQWSKVPPRRPPGTPTNAKKHMWSTPGTIPRNLPGLSPGQGPQPAMCTPITPRPRHRRPLSGKFYWNQTDSLAKLV